MKYLLLQLFTLTTKIIGLAWFWVAVPFRAYARSVVYNYALQGKVDLKRLMERKPKELVPGILEGGWVLQDVHNVGRNGFVKYRKVGAIKFWLVVFLLWGWVDDDANEDTFSAGHNDRYISGDLKNTWQAKLWRKQLKAANAKARYGNSFDLGDIRGESPAFSFPAALIWNTRNTAYNFNYLIRGV